MRTYKEIVKNYILIYNKSKKAVCGSNQLHTALISYFFSSSRNAFIASDMLLSAEERP